MLNTVNHGLQKFETAVAVSSLIVLLALSLFQILLRNLLDFGYPEIEIINRHLLVICGLMGATLATAKYAHIKTDALNVLLSDNTKRRLHWPLCLFACLICLSLSYYSAIFVSDEWQYAPSNERWTLPFTLIYPISFLLMATHFLLNASLKNALLKEP